MSDTTLLDDIRNAKRACAALELLNESDCLTQSTARLLLQAVRRAFVRMAGEADIATVPVLQEHQQAVLDAITGAAPQKLQVIQGGRS